MVIVGRDQDVFIGGNRTADDARYIAAHCAVEAVGDERLVEAASEEWFETVLSVQVSDAPCSSLSADSAGRSAFIHVVSQPFQDTFLLGLVDDLFVHCVRTQRPFALLLSGSGHVCYGKIRR